MSDDLSAQRDRIQRQVEELERSLAVTQNELDLLSSETDDGSGSEDEGQADLFAQREKIQTEIQNLEVLLGSHSPVTVSSDDSSDSSEESDLGLSRSVDSCLQLNLVYQQVVQETLVHLETLLTHNRRQQRELTGQNKGPIREPPKDGPTSSNQHPSKMFLGSFLKPYFKDRLTGLGPPANQETKLKAQRMMGCPNDKKLRVKRWESWQKTLLIHSVTRDRLKRLMQPKLSRLDYMTKKLSSAQEADRQQLTEQINVLEKEIELLRNKREEELIGDRYEEHDWQKISNIDFEGTKDAENIRLFWQNFLHPSINKNPWSSEEVQKLNEVCRNHQERHWERIAQELGTGRTAFMCLQTFQRFVSDSLKRSSWTPEEDDQLRELVQKMRIGNFIPYTQISYFMEGREQAQLIYRWNQVLDPNLKKGPWTKEEDKLLLQAVGRHGECWWKVRVEVPGRTDGACRDRYLDCLKKSIKKGAFEAHEVELLKKLVEKHGVGRWAKIAAEIPHRFDAQCMREWRKLVRHQDEDRKRGVKKTDKTAGRGGGRRKTSSRAAKVNIRRRILNIIKEEEEEEEELTEEEQEDEVVQYMDSDEDCKKKVDRGVEKEKLEEKVEEYVLPPMEEWIPAEVKQTSTTLNFTVVELPPSSDTLDETVVRSTVLGKSGPSVIIGPPPRKLSWEKRHASSAMLMASREALRRHLNAKKKPVTASPCKGRRLSFQSRDLGYELQDAITPWIGNLLIPKTARKRACDKLRERGESSGVRTSSVFLLLLQVMNVDTLGCREMIEQRKNRVEPQASPTTGTRTGPECPSEPLKKGTKQRRKQEELDHQRRMMLEQLQEALQEKHQKRTLLLQGPPQHQQLVFQGPPQRQQQVLLQGPPQGQQVLLQGPPQRQQLVLQGSPQGQTVLLQGPPQRQQVLLQGPPQRQQLVLQGPPQRQQLVLQGSPQGQQVLFQGSPQRQQMVLQGSPKGFHQGFAQGLLLPAATVYVAPVRSSSPAPANPRPVSFPSSSVSSSLTSTLVPPAPPAAAPVIEAPCSNQGSAGSEAELKDVGGANAGVKRIGDCEEGVVLDYESETRTRVCSPEPELMGKSDSQAGGGAPTSPSSSSPCTEQAPPTSTETPVRESRGRKRRCEEEVDAVSSEIQEGKRRRKPTLKIRESMEHQAKQKKKRIPASSKGSAIAQAPPPAQTPGFYHSMWVMTPSGPIPLVQAPPPVLQVGLTPNAPPTPIDPPVIQSPDPTPSSDPPRPRIVLPYGGVVKVDPMKPPPLRRVAIHFDSALMFLEPPEAVHDWLSGRGGVAVPGVKSALPYMPPFVSSLSALSCLLQAKTSLTTTSRQLLTGADEPRPQTGPGSAPDEPRPAEETPEQQEEQVKVIRQLVAERFSTNPAYQLLKARFLSLFTVPAFLATLQPIPRKKTQCSTNQEQEDDDDEVEEEEEEEELKKILERGKRRREERSLLFPGDSAASANHFSGICITGEHGADPDPVPQNQQTSADQNRPIEAGLGQTVGEP